MTTSWERGRPARTRPGTTAAISPSSINREERHCSPSVRLMGYPPTGPQPVASMAWPATRGISGRSGAPRRRTSLKGAGVVVRRLAGEGALAGKGCWAGRPRSQGMTPAARWGAGGRLLNNLTCTQSRDPRLPRTERRGRRPAEPGQACRITSGIVDAVARRFLGRTGTTIAESILPAFTDGSALEKPLQPTRL